MFNKFLKSHHPARQVKSFKYAFTGLFHALLNEANFRIQVTFAFFVLVIGSILGLSHLEWAVIVLANGFLLAAELLNTVVEEFMDYLITDYNEGVKVIKDLSAGFVLIAGLTNIVISILIFLPKLSSLV